MDIGTVVNRAINPWRAYEKTLEYDKLIDTYNKQGRHVSGEYRVRKYAYAVVGLMTTFPRGAAIGAALAVATNSTDNVESVISISWIADATATGAIYFVRSVKQTIDIRRNTNYTD